MNPSGDEIKAIAGGSEKQPMKLAERPLADGQRRSPHVIGSERRDIVRPFRRHGNSSLATRTQ